MTARAGDSHSSPSSGILGLNKILLFIINCSLFGRLVELLLINKEGGWLLVTRDASRLSGRVVMALTLTKVVVF